LPRAQRGVGEHCPSTVRPRSGRQGRVAQPPGRPSIEGSRPAGPTAAFALWRCRPAALAPLPACGSRSTAGRPV